MDLASFLGGRNRWKGKANGDAHMRRTGTVSVAVSTFIGNWPHAASSLHSPPEKITGPDKLYKSKLAGSEGAGSSTEHILSRPEIAGQRLLAKQADVRPSASPPSCETQESRS